MAQTGTSVASVTWGVPVIPINTLAQLDEYLGTAEEASKWLGIPASEVTGMRQRQLVKGISPSWFLRQWRECKALNAAAYARLSGDSVKLVRRQMDEGGHFILLDPITYRRWISVYRPLLEGFTIDEIKRARGGENVALMRMLFPGDSHV